MLPDRSFQRLGALPLCLNLDYLSFKTCTKFQINSKVVDGGKILLNANKYSTSVVEI